jgi:hypothetical protein
MVLICKSDKLILSFYEMHLPRVAVVTLEYPNVAGYIV